MVKCQGSSSQCQLSSPRAVTLVGDKLYIISPVSEIRVAKGIYSNYLLVKHSMITNRAGELIFQVGLFY